MFENFRNEDPSALRARVEATRLPVSLYDLLVQTAQQHGAAPAWHFIDDGMQRTWAQVLEGVETTAAAFSRLGIAPGAHVAVMSWNREEFALTWLALARLQAVMVPVNATYTEREVEHVLKTSDATFFVAESEFLPVIQNPLRERIAAERVVVIGDANAGIAAAHHRWDVLMHQAAGHRAPAVPRSRDRVINLQYTSGTTGFPKACMLTHDYWLVLAFSSTAFFGTELRRFYVGSSLFYMVGLRILLNAMVSGGCAFFPKKAGAKRFMPDVARFECDYCALFEMVYKQPPLPTDAGNKLKIATIFAFAPEHHSDFERRFDVRGQEYYGMTEIGGAAYMPTRDLPRMSGSGSCGVAAPFRELKVVDEAGNEVRRGEAGELVVRGRSMLQGYYKDPETSAAAFSDGWFHTGDIARMDDEGFVYILGRMKDMVRRSGENISAREVEDVLRGMPEIENAAVVAVPDPYREEEVKAYIQLAPGVTRDAVTPQHIIEHCKPRLAAFKLPRYIEYRDSFPLTDSQRVQKKVLRAEKADLRSGSYDVQEGVWHDERP
jgi:acyl-CoA synthetase (AMP-forming)/AMP-acid ligase II